MINEDSLKGERINITEVADWICNQATWTTLLTLTYKDLDKDQLKCDNDFRWLVRILNKELFGKRYTRKVGHSYFSYFIATEYQKRGTLHFHVLIDQPVNYKLIHDFWNRYFGFAQTTKIRDVYSTAIYAIKYVLKENDYRMYVAPAIYKPEILPDWWK